jgi:hypothetical protein
MENKHDDGRPQERSPDYRVVAAWSAFLLVIGAGAFVVGMPIHNESFAQPKPPRPEPIYYCATGQEFPAFEPCKERKDERNISTRRIGEALCRARDLRIS